MSNIQRTKNYRVLMELCEEFGLDKVDERPGGKHHKILLKNSRGEQWAYHMSYGGKAWHRRTVSNIRSDLKRFA
jgi:hypothetical protein